MTEMIDRVAIAIVNAMEASLPKFTQQHWDDLSIPAKAAYRARARAAIEVMREPTEAMEIAGLDANPRGPKVMPDYDAVAIFRAMTDEALK